MAILVLLGCTHFLSFGMIDKREWAEITIMRCDLRCAFDDAI